MGAGDNGEKRKQDPTRCLPLSTHNSKYNTHNNSSSGGSKRRNASAVARRPGVFQLKELVAKVELLFSDDDHSTMWTRVASFILRDSRARVRGRLRPHQRCAGVSGGFPGDSHREGHV